VEVGLGLYKILFYSEDRGGVVLGVEAVGQLARGAEKERAAHLHVEYAERSIDYGILCILSPVYESLGSQSHVRISSLCVCVVSPLYYQPSMNTVTLNMNMFLSNIGFTGRNTLLIFVWPRPRNT